MVLTGNEVIGFFNELNKIVEINMSGKLAVAVLNNIKLLEPTTEIIRESVKKINEQYEDESKRYAELELIGKEEFELTDFKKVELSEFEDCNNITPVILNNLKFMII